MMKSIKRVGMWPVGLVTAIGFESPILKNGSVTDFVSGWKASRKFSLDMAGFAVNIDFWRQKGSPVFYNKVSPGFQEDKFLKDLHFEKKDIEPLAWNCTKILTWHTKTSYAKVIPSKLERKSILGTNIEKLIDQVPTTKNKSKEEKLVKFPDNPFIVTSHKGLYTTSNVINAKGENNLNKTIILSTEDFVWIYSKLKTVSFMKSSTKQEKIPTGEITGFKTNANIINTNNNTTIKVKETTHNGIVNLGVAGNTTS